MLMMLEVYDLGWMDGMLNTRAISMQGSDCAPCLLPAWQVCCVVCCTEVEGWGVETVTGGRAGREQPLLFSHVWWRDLKDTITARFFRKRRRADRQHELPSV